MGQLRLCQHKWKHLTNDPWILKTINGLQLEFLQEPFQISPQITKVSGDESNQIIQKEVDLLLTKGAIVPVEPVPGQFISRLFLVDKKSGGKRPVINLRPLNKFIKKEHFKITGLKQVLEFIEEKDFLFTVDLTDAYFSVSIQPEFRKFFRFSWMGQLYEFLVMCFGLTTAPFIFTKITRPILAFLHSRGIRASMYIDDCISAVKTFSQALTVKDTVVNLLQEVGFVINFEKSSLIPSQQKVYLGFLIDTILMKVFVTQEKLEILLKALQSLLQCSTLTIQQLAHAIGKLVAAFPAFYQGPLHYRNLERLKTQQLYIHGSWNAQISLSQTAIQEIRWWLHNAHEQNGKPIRAPPVDVVMSSDASDSGWGALIESNVVSGMWYPQQSQLHINIREMLAVKLGLQGLATHITNRHILIQVDNTTVVSYLNRMGGTHSQQLDMLTRDIWEWAIQRQIHLSAVHLPGRCNVHADYLSRLSEDQLGWKLCPQVFLNICTQKFQPQVDLFATHLNTQLPLFVSWHPHPAAWATNAFALKWTHLLAYAFPPFILINKVILKIQAEKAHILLITPNWPTQVWWPSLLAMSVSHPILIPPSNMLLTLPPTGRAHPMAERLSLAVWDVSADTTSQKVYQSGLLKSSSPHGDEVLPRNTMRLGLSGVAGVIHGKVVPFLHL